VDLIAPAEAFPLLGPALRRPAAAGVVLNLYSVGVAELGFAPVTSLGAPPGWPGVPLVCVVDGKSALVASRQGNEVTGHWSTAPAFVASARLTIDGLARTA
jgi:hypothetical protein